MAEKIKVNDSTVMTREELKKEIEQIKKGIDIIFDTDVMNYQESTKISQLLYAEINRLEKLHNS